MNPNSGRNSHFDLEPSLPNAPQRSHRRLKFPNLAFYLRHVARWRLRWPPGRSIAGSEHRRRRWKWRPTGGFNPACSCVCVEPETEVEPEQGAQARELRWPAIGFQSVDFQLSGEVLATEHAGLAARRQGQVHERDFAQVLAPRRA